MTDDRQQRSAAIDMAKGVAIILVVYGHALRGLVAAGIVPDTPGYAIPDYVIYSFHMPLFFAASGYFYINAERHGASRFWASRLETIAYPYLIWSLVQALIQITLSGSGATNGNMTWDRLLSIAWEPISPFWFLYTLFFSYLLTWFLRPLCRMLPIVAGTGFLIAFLTVQGVVADILYGWLYFLLGMAARERGWLARLPSGLAATGLSVAVFLVLALACYALGVPERLPFPAAVAGIVATLVMCSTIEGRYPSFPVASVLVAFGRYSMGIYVMHILVLGLVRTAMVRFLHIEHPAAITLVAVPTALAVPMAVQFLLVRIGLNRIAGLPFSAAPGARPLSVSP